MSFDFSTNFSAVLFFFFFFFSPFSAKREESFESERDEGSWSLKKGRKCRDEMGSSWPRTVNIVFHVQRSGVHARARMAEFRERVSGVGYRVGMFRSLGPGPKGPTRQGPAQKQRGSEGSAAEPCVPGASLVMRYVARTL